jgi:hypothetical protein
MGQCQRGSRSGVPRARRHRGRRAEGRAASGATTPAPVPRPEQETDHHARHGRAGATAPAFSAPTGGTDPIVR